MDRLLAHPSYPFSFWKRLVAAIVGFHFLAALAMAASPALHEALHHDQDRHDHECAATMVADGAVHGAAAPLICPAPLPEDFVRIFSLPSQQIHALALAGQPQGRAPPLSLPQSV